MSESQPETVNVVYMDEYPELKKRVWLRRLAEDRLGAPAVGNSVVFLPGPPDDAA